jgi:hypothetical protein
VVRQDGLRRRTLKAALNSTEPKAWLRAGRFNRLRAVIVADIVLWPELKEPRAEVRTPIKFGDAQYASGRLSNASNEYTQASVIVRLEVIFLRQRGTHNIGLSEGSRRFRQCHALAFASARQLTKPKFSNGRPTAVNKLGLSISIIRVSERKRSAILWGCGCAVPR